MRGESPGFAIVKPAPLLPYVGSPVGVNWDEGPEVKSMVSDLPSAVSAGQPLSVRGLQDEYVCAVVGANRYNAATAKAAKDVVTRMLEDKSKTNRPLGCHVR